MLLYITVNIRSTDLRARYRQSNRLDTVRSTLIPVPLKREADRWRIQATQRDIGRLVPNFD